MPKITKGGVSDTRVDDAYMAPSGIDPATAMELGLPDAGAPEGIEADQRRAENERREREQDESTGEEESSRGKISSPDSRKQKQSTPKLNDDGQTQQTAQSTNGRSSKPRTGPNTASSADTK